VGSGQGINADSDDELAPKEVDLGFGRLTKEVDLEFGRLKGTLRWPASWRVVGLGLLFHILNVIIRHT